MDLEDAHVGRRVREVRTWRGKSLTTVAGQSAHRRDALIGLLDSYHAAANVADRLGFPGLPTLAVERIRQAAELLG